METLTFAGLARHVERIAQTLRGNGVATGEAVGIVGPNGPEWVAGCLGIFAAGAAAVPLDFQRTEAERARLIASAGCMFLLRADDPGFRGSFFEGESSELPSAGAGGPLLRLSGEPSPAENMSPAKAGPDDLALIVHTSGTTGTPKAVPLTHKNILSNISGLMPAGVAGPGERALLPLPLHHIYPLVVGLLLPLSAGLAVVLPGAMSGPELARALKAGGATVLLGVPRLYDALVAGILAEAEARGRPGAAFFHEILKLSIAFARRGAPVFGRLAFRSLRRQVSPTLYRMVSGGAALNEKTEWTLLGLGYEVLKGYGLSETGPILAFTRPGRSPPGAAGEALPGVALRIARPAADGTGEIEAKGPNVFRGYRGNPAATAAAFTPDGWFRTGDYGSIRADGYLYVRCRLSETLVLPGGEKLDPEIVESRYAESPAISEIGILAEEGKLVGLAVPSPAAGTGSAASAEAAIRAALASRAAGLPSYMQLSGFAVTQVPLPRTQIGKLRRHLLPALYKEAKARAEMRGTGVEMRTEDRALLSGPRARRVWEWLAARFPGRHLSLDMNLALDLGIDSLGWVTLTMDLERMLGAGLDEAALSRIVTVRDLIAAASQAGLPARAETGEALPSGKPALFSRAAGYALLALDRLLMRVLFRLRVEGLSNLPSHGPYILCSNHASYLDPLALAAALPWPVLKEAYWAGSADILFKSGWRRSFSRLARVFQVDPKLGVRAGLASAAAALQRGNVLVWFPEGWRSRDGNLQPFLPGIGALLLRTPVPAVPVYISGTFRAWPPHRRFPRPHAVAVRFGRPLEAERWPRMAPGADAPERIALSIKEAVAALAREAAE